MPPWDPPFTAPNRPGDRDKQALEVAVGRALSAWEGAEADFGGLLVILTGVAPEYFNQHVQTPRPATSISARVASVADASRTLFGPTPIGPGAEMANRLTALLDAYRGWSGRRNDVAHGYVTEAMAPDYSRDDQPLVTTYSLCPSHGSTWKWSHGEPTYNYNAQEIDAFARSFDQLAGSICSLSNEIREWRKLQDQ